MVGAVAVMSNGDGAGAARLAAAHASGVCAGAATGRAGRDDGRAPAALNGAGHEVQAQPDTETPTCCLTTAAWGEPIPWRASLLFSARRRFGLSHAPTVVTLLHATAAQLRTRLDEAGGGPGATGAFEPRLRLPGPDGARPSGAAGAGVTRRAMLGARPSGAIPGPVDPGRARGRARSARRAPTTSIWSARIRASNAPSRESFFDDMVMRLATAVSTHEVVEHEFVPPEVAAAAWQAAATPAAMLRAAEELDRRRFFTEMVRIADLVDVPALADAVAAQYSEGCFATWDPDLGGLVSTVTGSARPVDKGRITDADLALIVGMRPDGLGAHVRAIEGRPPTPPSSEAVEMMMMDADLPRVALEGKGNGAGRVPVLRSKLHGHRGVAAFDPRQVEFVPLDPAYHDYPVSCGTQAQAHGIQEAFRRSEAARSPADPRQIVFTVLPGHGVVLGEKWSPGKAPFQLLWEAMDSGALELVSEIPQGRYSYRPHGPERLELLEE